MKNKLKKIYNKIYSNKYDFKKVLPELSIEFFTLPLQLKEQDILSKCFSEKICEDRSMDEVCPICYIELKKGDIVTKVPVCCHEFHFDCLKVWLKKNYQCPICRGFVRQFMIQHYHGAFDMPKDKGMKNVVAERDSHNESEENGAVEMIENGQRENRSNNLENTLIDRNAIRI